MHQPAARQVRERRQDDDPHRRAERLDVHVHAQNREVEPALRVVDPVHGFDARPGHPESPCDGGGEAYPSGKTRRRRTTPPN